MKVLALTVLSLLLVACSTAVEAVAGVDRQRQSSSFSACSSA